MSLFPSGCALFPGLGQSRKGRAPACSFLSAPVSGSQCSPGKSNRRVLGAAKKTDVLSQQQSNQAEQPSTYS